MKVAVCISGACRTKRKGWSPARCVATIKPKFPDADFYYGTWDSNRPIFETLFPGEKCEYFPESEMHYHPYLDIEEPYQQLDAPRNSYPMRAEKFRRRRAKGSGCLDSILHSTKQILIHAWLSDKIKSNYDVIIRTRFDAVIYNGANFTWYLHNTFNTNSTHGFYTSRSNTLETLKHVSRRNEGINLQLDNGAGFSRDSRISGINPIGLIDSLIIHSPDAINADHVNTLHANKQLHGSEKGWHQVINLSHKPCKTFTNHHGWVLPIHCRPEKWLQENATKFEKA